MSCLFGRDEKVSLMSTSRKVQSGRRRPLENLSLVNIDHENLNLVDLALALALA